MTFPKETLPGVATSAAFSLVPVPARSTLCVEFGALSTNLMLPVIPWVPDGVNFTLKDKFFDAEIVDGNVRPLIAKPEPEICAALKTRSTFPSFTSVTACVVLCPTFTFPN